MSELVTIRGVSKRFAGLQAVDNADVDLREGKLYGLIGPNGAGKTTLVSLLGGELGPDAGSIAFAGKDITRYPAHRRAAAGIGRTFQRTRLPQSMTLKDAIVVGSLISHRASTSGYFSMLPRARSRYSAARRDAAALLERLELAPWGNSLVRDVPFFAQRKAEIARALSLRPRLLLLDEPTAGMSRDSLPAITETLKALTADGLTVLVIEHNVPFMRATVEYMYAMDAGRVISHGEPEAVLSDGQVVESYLGKSEHGARSL